MMAINDAHVAQRSSFLTMTVAAKSRVLPRCARCQNRVRIRRVTP